MVRFRAWFYALSTVPSSTMFFLFLITVFIQRLPCLRHRANNHTDIIITVTVLPRLHRSWMARVCIPSFTALPLFPSVRLKCLHFIISIWKQSTKARQVVRYTQTLHKHLYRCLWWDRPHLHDTMFFFFLHFGLTMDIIWNTCWHPNKTGWPNTGNHDQLN